MTFIEADEIGAVSPLCLVYFFTVPVEIRRLLGLKSGDKILFLQKRDGEIVISNASSKAIRKAQAAFAGAAEDMGVSDEDDVQALVDEMRYGKEMYIS